MGDPKRSLVSFPCIGRDCVARDAWRGLGARKKRRFIPLTDTLDWRALLHTTQCLVGILVGTLADQGSRFDSSCWGQQRDRLRGGLSLQASASRSRCCYQPYLGNKKIL